MKSLEQNIRDNEHARSAYVAKQNDYFEIVTNRHSGHNIDFLFDDGKILVCCLDCNDKVIGEMRNEGHVL